MTTRTNIVLGTAGHIDHGKSALIEALTGTDPDRLAEEKERGITIELGFAQLELPDGSRMGIVDVPGHERFVRQMISGSTGIDIALLCIAADDGIMPQTREHLAVLDLLAIPTCVVALTKCDRVDDEWADMVADEVRASLSGGRFADAPIVKTSARTGDGLDELRDTLLAAARGTTSTHRSSIVRMPVDRVFTIRGAGTVVTGTLWSGTVALDDELEVLPSGERSRVRSIQMHDVAAETAPSGNRVALNLGGLKTSDVRPGDFLATPDTIRPTDRFDCRFVYASPLSAGKPLKSGARVRIAHGTKEVFGRLLLMDGQPSLDPHASCYAQIRLEEPLPLSCRDRFIARSESPVQVIGGGVALLCRPRRRTTLSSDDRALLDALAGGDMSTAVGKALVGQTAPVSVRDLAVEMGLPVQDVESLLEGHEADGLALRLSDGDEGLFTTKRVLQKAIGSVENTLMKFHAENPQALGVKKNDLLLRSGLRMDDAAFDAVLARAVSVGKAVIDDGVISHPQAGAGAKAAEKQNARKVADALAAAGVTPPTTDELTEIVGLSTSAVARALNSLEKDGEVVRIDKTFAFDAEAMSKLKQAVTDRITANGPTTVADLRDAMGVSRKYAVPLLEYFDTSGLTVREDDLRKLA